MYTNVACFHPTKREIVDMSVPLLVSECGYYRIHTQRCLPTERPQGRKDYQLLYIAKGKAYFYFDGKEHILQKGTAILYRPHEAQMYYYYAADKTEMYWVHFTGYDTEKILSHFNLKMGQNVCFVGVAVAICDLFDTLIRELQLCRENYKEIVPLSLYQIFATIDRLQKEKNFAGATTLTEIEEAVNYFNKNYNKDIKIADYAKERLMSTCWFIRSFKNMLNQTPMQYILSLRMTNAKNLLENTTYNISEIANLVGYDNALYFSRIFSRHTGLSPTEYRKNL